LDIGQDCGSLDLYDNMLETVASMNSEELAELDERIEAINIDTSRFTRVRK
jgi:hypothetical protein